MRKKYRENAKRPIYVLYRGDPKDGKILCISSRMYMLRDALEILLREDPTISFTDEDGNVIPEYVDRIRLFRKEWKDMTRENVNDRLVGVYISTAFDGALF